MCFQRCSKRWSATIPSQFRGRNYRRATRVKLDSHRASLLEPLFRFESSIFRSEAYCLNLNADFVLSNPKLVAAVIPNSVLQITSISSLSMCSRFGSNCRKSRLVARDPASIGYVRIYSLLLHAISIIPSYLTNTCPRVGGVEAINVIVIVMFLMQRKECVRVTMIRCGGESTQGQWSIVILSRV